MDSVVGAEVDSDEELLLKRENTVKEEDSAMLEAVAGCAAAAVEVSVAEVEDAAAVVVSEAAAAELVSAASADVLAGASVVVSGVDAAELSGG